MKQHQPRKRQHPDRTLDFSSAAWQRLRKVVLNRDPICVDCYDDYGTVTPSQHVDHRDNNPSNNDLDNLQGLCGPCHSRKTARDMGKRVSYGCDANGFPLDPDHHWNRERNNRQQSSAEHRPPTSTRKVAR